MVATVYARTLRRAAEILGGIDQLRAYLRVPGPQLRAWLEAAEKPPLDVFLKIVDLIYECGPQAAGAQRIRVGPNTARCNTCDGMDFTLLDPGAPVTSTSVLECIRCKQRTRRGDLVVSASDEGAKRGAAWLNRTRRPKTVSPPDPVSSEDKLEPED